jgi:ketosteroid isomerase-like protein
MDTRPRIGTDHRSIGEELATLRGEFQAAVGCSDVTATADAYAADASLILPSGVAIGGRDAIEHYWRTGFEAGMSRLEVLAEGIEIGDRIAWEFGRYGLSATPPYEPPTTEVGRYLTVLRLGEDGRWRRALDLLNPTALMVTTGRPAELTAIPTTNRTENQG